MSQHIFPLADLVVASGQTDSNVLSSDGAIVDMAHSGDGFRDASYITIFAPDTLPELATVYVDSGLPGAPVNFNPLQRAGADLTVPAGKAVTVDGVSFRAIRITLGGAAGATRTFKVNKGVWV